MYLLQYQGIGPTSRIIEAVTRSPWSHSAVAFANHDKTFTLVEAWGFKGVCRINHATTLIEAASVNHRANTVVDVSVFDVSEKDYNDALNFVMAQVGAKYDWSLILKFLTRKRGVISGKWICSELAHRTFRQAGITLQNARSTEMAPYHLGISPVNTNWFKIRTI